MYRRKKKNCISISINEREEEINRMLRNLCASLESSRKILTSSPSKWWRQTSPYSTATSDHDTPPKLLVVQPRLRSEKLLQAKLNEALCLANSLEDQRDGYFHTDFFDKPLPPHVLVQNPSLKGHKPRAGSVSSLNTFFFFAIYFLYLIFFFFLFFRYVFWTWNC